MSILDLDSAVSLMNTAPAAPGTNFEPTESDAGLPDEPAESDAAPAAADTPDTASDAPSGDDAGQDTDDNQDTPPAAGETTDEQADQGALPTIEPPSSWKKEEQDVFKSLPRAAQEAIARREQDRTTELRNLQNATAAEKQAMAAEATRLKGLATQVDAVVNTQVAEMQREFPEIRSEADVSALAANNPARFAVFQAKLMGLNATQQAQANARQEAQRLDAQATQERLSQAKTALIEAFPAWSDPAVAQKEVIELQDYAISIGVPEAQARQTLDPHVYKLAQKAMLYDRAQTAAKAALDRTPPKAPLKPGSGGTGGKGERTAEARQNQLRKLERSGSLEDAVGLLRQ